MQERSMFRNFVFLVFLSLGTFGVCLLNPPPARAIMCCTELDGYYELFVEDCYAGNYHNVQLQCNRSGIHVTDLNSCLACAYYYRHSISCDPGC
jgi:hypothetical protein